MASALRNLRVARQTARASQQAVPGLRLSRGVRVMTLPELTPDHLRTLRHMLGINDGRLAKPVPYRNHYAANQDDPHMLELERAGAVWRRVRAADDVSSGYDIWHATDAGQQAAIASCSAVRCGRAELEQTP